MDGLCNSSSVLRLYPSEDVDSEEFFTDSSVCVCVLYTCSYGCVHLCVLVQRAEVDTGCLSPLSATLLFETRFLVEPEAHPFGEAG